MKHLKTLNYLILSLVLAGAGALAQAAEVGQGYVSAFIGQSEVDVDYDVDVDIEGDDTSYRIGGGFRVNENFAVEGYYIDYGEIDDSIFVPFFGDVELEAEATAFQFQAVGLFPASPSVDLYGKIGLAIWDAELSAPGFADEDDDGTDLVFGFGANFNISKQFTLRAEYEIANFDDVDIDTIMIGVNVAF